MPLIWVVSNSPVWCLGRQQQHYITLLETQTTQPMRYLVGTLGEMRKAQREDLLGVSGIGGIPHHGHGIPAGLTPVVHDIAGEVEMQRVEIGG